ncbi:hypothetical protein [Paludisphaera mucosa]|uniref:Uncharacterized protein n=1 Tax=Paludisphaera mucosa TaxID=3030827 RepID=A0ABT6FG31_9BACT|nr:hypothetical protein [Paludisphaera mucosa]MDG3006446.1 hypothetical protein [Paludisphaera mucosa]
MDQGFAQIVFVGLVAWIFYMLTFRLKDFIVINDHMRGNIKDAGNVAGKATGIGLKVLSTFLKK